MRKLILCIVFAVGTAAWQVAAQEPTGQPPEPGHTAVPAETAAALYDRYCLACHGVYGDGKGPAAPWLWPRPRDFTRGEYKWRSTPTGEAPTAADLAAAIRHGAPGTSMHAFADSLDPGQIAGLVEYIQQFAAETFQEPVEPVTIGAPPTVTQPLIARGEQAYARLGCVACHGDTAAGDGPAASALFDAEGRPSPPFDLTTQPLRRPGPRSSDALGGPPDASDRAAVVSVYTTLVTGLAGTAMPSYAGSAPDDELWAVAAYVASLRFRGDPVPADPTVLSPTAIELDRKNKLARVGFWPGHGSPDEEAIWSQEIPLQGPPPAGLTPAQASLDALQCARCHAKQVREWRGTLHAEAASPGLLAQYVRASPGYIESCQVCHAPLAEQSAHLPVPAPGDGGKKTYVANPRYDEALSHQGIQCASCHLRRWQRHGPPLVPEAKLLALDNYPLAEQRIYERSDFCLPCHQLPPGGALERKPLLNTYREWLEGPYMRRGVQCQHCHMPNREHTWKGVHDPDTFRQGVKLEAIAGRSTTSGAVSVRTRVHNVGAGHYLPTTPTPCAWLSVELVDAAGRRIRGAYAEKRIGRHIDFQRGWIEHEDTRIPPGDNLELAAAWKDGDVAAATHAKIVLRVEPDEYYERFYRRKLAGRITATQRDMYEEALRHAEGTHYVALEQLVAIDRR